MATGSLELTLTDLSGAPLQGDIDIQFTPTANTGGDRMEVQFPANGATRFTVSNLECRSGLGTLYRVFIQADKYRPYSFFQQINESATATSPDNAIGLAVLPNKVRGIIPPPLDPALGAILPNPNFFHQLDPMSQACLLNIFAKATHNSTSKTFRFVSRLVDLQQDRVFCQVDPEIENFLTKDERFKSAPSMLHKPPAGYEHRGSFKSRDAHANIQYTLFREVATGNILSDIDIDEAAGIEHGFEVIRNSVTKGKTNPYQIHELLLLAEIDPGYQLVLR